MRCPLCQRLECGQVGNSQYYCWNCCLEFHGEPGNWRLFNLDEEGGLVELADAPPPTAVASATQRPELAAP